MEGQLKLQKEELEQAEEGNCEKKMKAEYEAVEEQVDIIDAAFETSKTQLNETNLLKQQLEGPDQCSEGTDQYSG